jgi:hypothetical protein
LALTFSRIFIDIQARNRRTVAIVPTSLCALQQNRAIEKSSTVETSRGSYEQLAAVRCPSVPDL